MKKIVIVILSLCALTQYNMYGAKIVRSQQNTPATTSSTSTTTQQTSTPAATTSSSTTKQQAECNITISFQANTQLPGSMSLKIRNKDNAVVAETNSTSTALVIKNITKNTLHKITLEAETGAIASTLPFTPTSCGQKFNIAISDFSMYFTDKPTSTLAITVLNPKKLTGGSLEIKLKENNKPEQSIGGLNITQTSTKKVLTIPKLSSNNYTLTVQDETGKGSFQPFQGASNVNFNLFVGEFGDQRFYTLYK